MVSITTTGALIAALTTLAALPGTARAGPAAGGETVLAQAVEPPLLIPKPIVRPRIGPGAAPRKPIPVPQARRPRVRSRAEARQLEQRVLGAQPTLPWDAALKRFNDRSTRQLRGPDPVERFDLSLRKLNQDPMMRLGFPANPALPAEGEAGDAVPPPPAFDLYSGLDRDRDGAISKSEYFQGRTRALPAGPRGAAMRKVQRQRLESRFRSADRDGDGKISPEELEELQNHRF